MGRSAATEKHRAEYMLETMGGITNLVPIHNLGQTKIMAGGREWRERVQVIGSFDL